MIIRLNLDQFKVIDTRRVKVPNRNIKSTNYPTVKTPEGFVERTSVQHVVSPPPSAISTSISPPTLTAKVSIPSPNIPQTPTVPPDYRFLLAWSYYLASQAAWLSPMLQQQGQLPSSLPTDPEAAAKFLQTMQSMMEPLATSQMPSMTNGNDHDETDHMDTKRFVVPKEEANES